jgi:hypothetical protein
MNTKIEGKLRLPYGVPKESTLRNKAVSEAEKKELEKIN